jgi:hypothetical protein
MGCETGCKTCGVAAFAHWAETLSWLDKKSMPPSMASVMLAAKQKETARDKRLVCMVGSGGLFRCGDD